MAWSGPLGRSCDLLRRMQQPRWLCRRKVDLTLPSLWSPPVPFISWPNQKSGKKPFDKVQTGQVPRPRTGDKGLGDRWAHVGHKEFVILDKVILQSYMCRGVLCLWALHTPTHMYLPSTQHHWWELAGVRYSVKYIIYFIFSRQLYNLASNQREQKGQ